MFKKIPKLILFGILFLTVTVFAGSFDPSPSSPGAGDYTLLDIYNKITSGTDSSGHDFAPTTTPSGTYVTLTEIWDVIPPFITLTAGDLDSGVLPAGIYSTTTDLLTLDANLLPENIATGTSVFGVVGTALDTVMPVITDFSIYIPSSPPDLTVALNFSATDFIGITDYLIKETADIPDINDSGWTSILPVDYVFNSDGPKVLYAWVKDAAGNISIGASDSVTFTPTLTWSSLRALGDWWEVTTACEEWGGRLPVSSELLAGFIDQFRNSGSNPGGFIDLQGYWTSSLPEGYWMNWSVADDSMGNGVYAPGPGTSRCVYP